MKLLRSIVPLPKFVELDQQAQSNVHRMQRSVDSLRQDVSDTQLDSLDWLAMAGERLAHPLAAHALERNGRPDYRQGRTASERSAATHLAAAALATLRPANAASFGGLVVQLANAMGVVAPRLRSETSQIGPDKLGNRIEFPDPSIVQDRLAALAEYVSDSTDPTCLKAMVFQVAFLNLHPLSNGNGRVSRVLFNRMIWGDDAGARRYFPLYELRKHAPFSFELSLRSAEIHGSWTPLTLFYADFADIYLDSTKGNRE